MPAYAEDVGVYRCSKIFMTFIGGLHQLTDAKFYIFIGDGDFRSQITVCCVRGRIQCEFMSIVKRYGCNCFIIVGLKQFFERNIENRYD